MDFFKVKRFKLGRRHKAEEHADPEDHQLPAAEALKDGSMESAPKTDAADGDLEEEDYDDDDFITNEVKRRLKELRKNSFMVLIPEESCLEEDVETSSSEWRESEVEEGYPPCGFEALYSKYCERMLFFDKMIVQHLKEAESFNVLNGSPRSVTKKLALTLKSLSFKRRYEFQDDCEQLQPSQEDDPYQNLEIAYVAQLGLSWEALHCQYMQLSQRISTQPENMTCYGCSSQEFQQFQVLLQRFIENEPFEQGSRVEIYARARSLLPKLLQVPNLQGPGQKESENGDLEHPVLASELLNIMEDSILTFRQFLKTDKQKFGRSLSLFKSHNQDASSLHQVQASLDKKEMKVKELSKKKGWKKTWPSTPLEVEFLFSLIDIKVVRRVLRMAHISKEQLLWCEEKMSKLDLANNKLHRDGAAILFPC
ncbi:hypothetical protein AXF42_Ash004948 [Apostasia shenzhenica]|uniref:Uncharacterized protein n=1 Tax=Apostasia shenzhenica TaxID=1088818 RepID=A0A2I0B808_9ASPA|nr:hypothetical protein AXF42_Ash004948 [Apostasia shenzhenica]